MMFELWKAIGVAYMSKKYNLRFPESDLETHVSSTTMVSVHLKSQGVTLGIKANESRWKRDSTGVAIEAQLIASGSGEVIETVSLELVWQAVPV